MRTIVTFHSSAFNTAESKPYFINPGCFGDDLARWLRARFREAGVTTDEEPGREDFGWYLNFATPEEPHTCVVGLRPGEADREPEWVLWIERTRGLMGSMFGGRRRGIAPSAITLLHRVLSNAPDVAALRWHEQHDFDAGREETASVVP